MPKNKKIRFVIFDFGGVVVKWHDDKVYRAAAAKWRLPFGRVKSKSDLLLAKMHLGKISEKKFWQLLAKQLNSPSRPLKPQKEIWLGAYKKKHQPRYDVINLARKLQRHGIRCPILSNSLKETTRYNMRYLRNFYPLFLSHKMHMRKPERRAYACVLRRLKAKPYECLFIDDSRKNVAAARRSGMHAMKFTDAGAINRRLKRLGVNV